jgi:hypothetical protein
MRSDGISDVNKSAIRLIQSEKNSVGAISPAEIYISQGFGEFFA